MTFTKVEERLALALRKLCDEQACLIKVDANERSITHHLAIYLQYEFTGWHVDVEYNRHFDDPKRQPRRPQEPPRQPTPEDTDAVTVFPDIIVHHRGTDQNNLLVVEVKKASRDDPGDDYWKLEQFTKPLPEGYGYRWGVHVVLPAARGDAQRKTWFKNGVKCHERFASCQDPQA